MYVNRRHHGHGVHPVPVLRHYSTVPLLRHYSTEPLIVDVFVDIKVCECMYNRDGIPHSSSSFLVKEKEHTVVPIDK